MPSILVDAGPLIALFDRDDRYHTLTRGFIRDSRARLVTAWPSVTEASHLLSFDVRAQLDLLRWIDAGGLTVFEMHPSRNPRLVALMSKYSDRPRDLADAVLVLAAEQLDIRHIVSVDRDFDIYRTEHGTIVTNVLSRPK
jgi:uncharacterized protein